MSRLSSVARSLLAIALFLLPSAAHAQTGTIAGQVRDSQGGALPGVTVEVSSPALIEKIRSTQTDGNGRYQIGALPVGTYQVRFSLENFNTVSRSNVVVTSDFTATVSGDLKIGARTETVNVVAEAPVVDVQNARVQQVFQGSDIAELPTTRDVPGLMLLVPSLVTSSGVCSGGVGIFCQPFTSGFNSHMSDTRIPFFGLADADGANQGRIMVDGMVINAGRNNLAAGITNGIVQDVANVQEVTFTLSGALGESETGGASINIVPRTGGNRYAGNYFTSYTSTRWFDRNRDTRLTTQDTQEYNYDYDVTGAFGGPIRRDRFWFYLNARHRGQDQYPNGGTIPGYLNLNEGKFAANYLPDRDRGQQSFRNLYRNAAVRLTAQVSQKNKLNLYWDEQDACTNPCYGMINVVDSPEAYFTLQQRPNHLSQLSWTNPFTNRLLFEAGITAVLTHSDTTKHREFPNYRHMPRVCETGPTVGRDAFGLKVNTAVANTQGGAGSCSVFTTMNSGSLNAEFPNSEGAGTLVKDKNFRSRASASYITGSHNAKLGYEGVYYEEQFTNSPNDLRMNYHYQTPASTGTWNNTTRTGNCLDPAAPLGACGNMALYYPEDPYNLQFMRPKPVGFRINTGPVTADERTWFGALFIQDQWTLNRFTLNGAVRYDHAESRYGESCVGPDVYVPTQTDGRDFWCSPAKKGARYNDITPRWGVAWDVFGNGKTSIKWNMGKYLQAASLSGLYNDDNDIRRSTNGMTRGWDDLNGNRIVDCEIMNPAPHTLPGGDFCASLFTTGTTTPTNTFQQFGRQPTSLFNPDTICGRHENSSQRHQDYCALAGQNLMTGWGARRYEWQFGLGVQHELLPRLSVEVTYNRRKYGNLTDSDTLGRGCDYFLAADPTDCFNRQLDYESDQHDFYMFTAPIDPRLPNGGGYVIRGLSTQKQTGGLPDLGDVTVLRDELEYSWNGVDTNFVLRARGGLRVSGGTSTGRSNRDTCHVTDFDTPNVKGRVGNEYRGGCRPYRPFQTNVRANASYTIPWVDLLVGAVFQYRPGPERDAELTISNLDVQWEAASAHRAGTQFFGNTATSTANVDLLDTGDLYGEGLRLWDLNFSKNIRFAGRRVNFGVNVYNVFNSDAATGYEEDYTAFRLADGTWVADNPATANVEVQDWGRVTSITTPRFLRFTVSFDF
jgi:hypothetical protein